MAEFFVFLLMSLVGAIGFACAINFFLRLGPWRSFGYGLFAVAVCLVFFISGLWENGSRHAWGPLTPVFAIILLGGWVSLKFGKRIWEWLREKKIY